MKIVTWNINGLRSLKEPISEILKKLDADIVCFQETKITRNLLSEDIAFVEGYSSYFSFSRKQSGYSGVAIYCKDMCTPHNSDEGLSSILNSDNKSAFVLNEDLELNEFMQSADIYDLDSEGRAVITYHNIKCDTEEKKLAIINIYCPRVDPEKPERHIFKMRFCNLLAAKAKSLSKNSSCVIIVGDMNIAHAMIDSCDPGDEETFLTSDTRVWFTSFLSSLCTHSCRDNEFLDTFRYLHPSQKEAYTCWNTRTGGRETNYGTRIDYILANCLTVPYLESCEILSDVQGSDHCPVVANFKFTVIPAKKPPPLCTRFYPEFFGKQQKLDTFFQGHTSLKNKQKCDLETNLFFKKAKTQDVKTKSKNDKQKSIINFISLDRKKVKTNDLKNETPVSKLSINETIFDSSSLKSQCEIHESDDNQTEQNRDEAQCITKNNESDCTDKWRNLLSGPPRPPLCKQHKKVCVLRTVKKSGNNYGRQFFCCSQPDGPSSNPDSRCNFFQWVIQNKK